jgi:hypothetical protein
MNVTEFKIAANLVTKGPMDNTEDNRRFHRESKAAVCHHIEKGQGAWDPRRRRSNMLLG